MMKLLLPLFSLLVLGACMQTKLDTSSAEAFAETSEKVMQEVDGTSAEKREVRRMLSEVQMAFGISQLGGLFGGGSSRQNAKMEEVLNELDGKTADDLVDMIKK